MGRAITNRKSGFILRGGTMRRESLWFAGVAFREGEPVGGATIVASLNAAALALRPFTIVRTRGLLLVTSDQIANIEPQAGAFGMAIVSDQAVSAGITAVPTPTLDSGSDLFFVYERLLNEFTISSAVGIQASAGSHTIVDSKAMRKVEDGQDMIQVTEAEASTSHTQGMNIAGFMRVLIKLH